MISSYISSMLGYIIVFDIFYIPLRLFYIKKKKKELSLLPELFIGLFLSYLVGLFSQTIIPVWQMGFCNGEFYFQVSCCGSTIFNYSNLNLVPFKTIREYLFEASSINYTARDWIAIRILNLSSNLGLFIPFGLLFPLVSKRMRKIKNILLSSIILAVFIEFVQYFVGRTSDIDDVILNTIGALAGYALFKFGYLIFKKIQLSKTVQHINLKSFD